jgi:hypothetical protein
MTVMHFVHHLSTNVLSIDFYVELEVLPAQDNIEKEWHHLQTPRSSDPIYIPLLQRHRLPRMPPLELPPEAETDLPPLFTIHDSPVCMPPLPRVSTPTNECKYVQVCSDSGCATRPVNYG